MAPIGRAAAVKPQGGRMILAALANAQVLRGRVPMPTTRITSRPAGLTFAFALVLGLAACASGAPSEEAATASPEPSPTEAPVDIAEEFAAKAEGLDTFAAELSGTLRVAGLEGEVSGDLEVVGSDVHSLTVVTFPGLPEQETETISVGGTRYQRSENGYWLQLPAGGSGAAGSDPVTAALANTDALEVVGAEEHDGETLHRIESSGLADIPPEALGITDPTVSDFEAEVAFLAEADGTPAGIIVTAAWVQGPADAPVEAEFDLLFLFVGDGVATVEAPDDPWAQYQSAELGYQMDHPADWDVTHMPAEGELVPWDFYLGPVDGEVQVYRYADLAGVTANQWFRDSAALLAERFGSEPELATVMSLDNGLEVQVFVGEYTEGEVLIHYQQAVVVGQNVAWDLDWFSTAGNEVEDGARFTQFVLSFEPSAQ